MKAYRFLPGMICVAAVAAHGQADWNAQEGGWNAGAKWSGGAVPDDVLGALDRQTDCEVITCAPGALTGAFAYITALPTGWRVRYDRANGKVWLAAIKGTLILVR